MQKGYIEVEFNGENKPMRFDFNALADIEELYGKGIATVMDDENIGFRTIRALYWAGLKWKDRGLTIERTGQMIEQKLNSGCDFNDLMQPIVEALQASGLLKSQTDAHEDDDTKN